MDNKEIFQENVEQMANVGGMSLVDAQEAIQAANNSFYETNKFIVFHFYKPKTSKTEIFREQTREAMAERIENEKTNNVQGAIQVLDRKLIRATIAASLSTIGNIGASKFAGLQSRRERREEARNAKQTFEPQYN